MSCIPRRTIERSDFVHSLTLHFFTSSLLFCPLFTVHCSLPMHRLSGGPLISRYTRPAMGRIWTEEHKYRCWLQVEAAASAVLAEDGVIPASAAAAIATKATVSAARVTEIEAEVKH